MFTKSTSITHMTNLYKKSICKNINLKYLKERATPKKLTEDRMNNLGLRRFIAIENLTIFILERN